MAHTKAIGAGKYGKDSQPKYLGVKLFGGEKAKVGSIIIRQRGTKFLAGIGTKRAADDSIFAMCDGLVKFTTKHKIRFDGTKRLVKVVNVLKEKAKSTV